MQTVDVELKVMQHHIDGGWPNLGVTPLDLAMRDALVPNVKVVFVEDMFVFTLPDGRIELQAPVQAVEFNRRLRIEEKVEPITFTQAVPIDLANIRS